MSQAGTDSSDSDNDVGVGRRRRRREQAPGLNSSGSNGHYRVSGNEPSDLSSDEDDIPGKRRVLTPAAAPRVIALPTTPVKVKPDRLKATGKTVKPAVTAPPPPEIEVELSEACTDVMLDLQAVNRVPKSAAPNWRAPSTPVTIELNVDGVSLSMVADKVDKWKKGLRFQDTVTQLWYVLLQVPAALPKHPLHLGACAQCTEYQEDVAECIRPQHLGTAALLVSPPQDTSITLIDSLYPQVTVIRDNSRLYHVPFTILHEVCKAWTLTGFKSATQYKWKELHRCFNRRSDYCPIVPDSIYLSCDGLLPLSNDTISVATIDQIAMGAVTDKGSATTTTKNKKDTVMTTPPTVLNIQFQLALPQPAVSQVGQIQKYLNEMVESDHISSTVVLKWLERILQPPPAKKNNDTENDAVGVGMMDVLP